MTLTKLKNTRVLVFTNEEFEKICNAVQAVTNLDYLSEYIGSEKANLLWDIEENIINQLGVGE